MKNGKRKNSREQWWPIDRSNGWYEVSNHGRARSWVGHAGRGRRKEPLILKPYFVGRNPKYAAIALRRGAYVKVHIAVMEAFVGPRPDGMVINHLDSDTSNNRLDNLEYTTPSGNVKHSFRVGNSTPRRGEASNKAKLTEDDVRAIRDSDDLDAVIAERYGISGQHVRNIRYRRQWKHVP